MYITQPAVMLFLELTIQKDQTQYNFIIYKYTNNHPYGIETMINENQHKLWPGIPMD